MNVPIIAYMMIIYCYHLRRAILREKTQGVIDCSPAQRWHFCHHTLVNILNCWMRTMGKQEGHYGKSLG